MKYLIAAYAITIVTLLVYGLLLEKEQRALSRNHKSNSG